MLNVKVSEVLSYQMLNAHPAGVNRFSRLSEMTLVAVPVKVSPEPKAFQFLFLKLEIEI